MVASLNGKPPLIFEDGLQGRDFINVKDIVQGLILALTSETANYEAINLGTGCCLSILDIAQTLIRLLNSRIEPQIVNQYRAGDIRCCYADIRKAQRLFDYQPKVTLEAGMAELIEWLQQQTAEDKVDTATAELAKRGLTR